MPVVNGASKFITYTKNRVISQMCNVIKPQHLLLFKPVIIKSALFGFVSNKLPK